MRLNDLFESNYTDVYSKSFESFLSDYKDIYDNDLFVVFSDKEYLSFHDNLERKDLPSGMVGFPVNYVVRHPAKFVDFANKTHMHVVSSKRSLFRLNDVGAKGVAKLGDSLGVDSEELHAYLEKNRKSFRVDRKLLHGYVFYNILWREIVDGKITSRKITSQEVSTRLMTLGVNNIYDSSTELGSNLMSEHFLTQVVFLKPHTYSVENVYTMRGSHNKGRTSEDKQGEQYFKDKTIIRKLSAKVAQALGTKLHSDETYPMFLDFYSWTVDGIQIKITVAFSSSSSDYNDGIYYIIEASTPFGILVHSSKPSESYDAIAADVKRTYDDMTVSLDEWRPTNRDIFLNGVKRSYRLIDDQIDDVVASVDEHYPELWAFGRRFNINVPVVKGFSSLEKVYIELLVELFVQRDGQNMTQMMKQLEDSGFNFDQLAGRPMPEKITVDLIKKYALIYDIAKKKFPKRKGWYLFKYF